MDPHRELFFLFGSFGILSPSSLCRGHAGEFFCLALLLVFFVCFCLVLFRLALFLFFCLFLVGSFAFL